MKSVIELEIVGSRPTVAELFAAPENTPRWTFGLLARPAIRRAHRRHMDGFKLFAERQAQAGPTGTIR
jgi:hypothetical protein